MQAFQALMEKAPDLPFTSVTCSLALVRVAPLLFLAYLPARMATLILREGVE